MRSVVDSKTPAGSAPATTFALASVNFAAVAGLSRTLGGGFAPLRAGLVISFVISFLAWMWRRRRLPAPGVMVVAAVSLGVAWLVLPDTTTYGLPGLATLEAARSELVALLAARNEGTPVGEVARGLGVVIVVIVGFCSYLSDHAAFRMRTPLMALVPAFTLLLGGTTPGRSTLSGLALPTVLALALIYLVVQRAEAAPEVNSWGSVAPLRPGRLAVSGLGEGLAARLAARLPAAAAMSALVMVAAVVGGPLMPGVGTRALAGRAASPANGLLGGVGRSSGSSPGSLVFDPLVDLGDSLGPLSNLEVFRVQADRPSYWRLAGLDTFDGQRWTASEPDSFGSGSPGRDPALGASAPLVQQVTIGGMVAESLPAAFAATRVLGTEATVDGDSGTLRRLRGLTTPGMSYRVISDVAQLTGAELRSLGQPGPGVDNRYLRLPNRFSNRLVSEARRVGANATSSYDVALALQNYFRSGFTYDLTVKKGHGSAALEEFVFETKRGYCEQFAAAYAAMARVLGLPARVAVGFTPGELLSTGEYAVRGRNAHAWPEVFLGRAGWVAFEPTPGRGAPGAEAYTGVRPAQAGASGTDVAPFSSPLPTGTPAPVPTTPPPVPTVAPQGSASPPTTAALGPDSSNAPQGPGQGDPSTQGRGVSAPLLAVVLLMAVVLAAGAIPVLKLRRLERRRRGVRSANEQVVVSWLEVTESLDQVGLGRRAWETPLEHARRAAGDERLVAAGVAPGLVHLAGHAADASYRNEAVDAVLASEVAQSADQMCESVARTRPRLVRVKTMFDPRPLRRPWR